MRKLIARFFLLLGLIVTLPIYLLNLLIDWVMSTLDPSSAEDAYPVTQEYLRWVRKLWQ
jgi:Na+-driven multidrug efflux pump